MNHKTLLVGLLTLMLALSIIPAGSPVGADATLTVCPDGPPACDYATISDAVAAAVAGDTIDVAAGDYAENVNVAKAGLTLLGAKSGVPAGPAKDPEDRGSDESVLHGAITLKGAGVTLDGFTLAPPTGVAVHVRGSDLTITNNILEGAGVDGGNGIRAINFDGVEFTSNNVQNFRIGLLLDGGPTAQPSLVESNYIGNLFHGVSMFGSLAGGHTFTENLFEDIENGGLVIVQPLEVTQNTFRNISSYGILVWGIDQTSDVLIESNEIRDNGFGIWVYDDGGAPENNRARLNVIAGNGIGIRNDVEVSFDAQHNYWGAPTGTLLADHGIGDRTIGDVDSSQWCILEDCSVQAPELPV